MLCKSDKPSIIIIIIITHTASLQLQKNGKICRMEIVLHVYTPMSLYCLKLYNILIWGARLLIAFPVVLSSPAPSVLCPFLYPTLHP